MKEYGLRVCWLGGHVLDGEKAQAVLSFGPSASLHPPTPDGAVPPAYGRGWPGSSGQHRLRPCHPLLPFIAKVARTSPAYGRGWPGSSGQHRLRPMHKSTVAIPCLPAWSTRKLSISTIPPLRLPGLSTRKQFAPLPLTSLAGTTNLSSCMGLSTIIRHGAIGYRTDSLFQIANTL